jgi:hypothetical protein
VEGGEKKHIYGNNSKAGVVGMWGKTNKKRRPGARDIWDEGGCPGLRKGCGDGGN